QIAQVGREPLPALDGAPRLREQARKRDVEKPSVLLKRLRVLPELGEARVGIGGAAPKDAFGVDVDALRIERGRSLPAFAHLRDRRTGVASRRSCGRRPPQTRVGTRAGP